MSALRTTGVASGVREIPSRSSGYESARESPGSTCANRRSTAERTDETTARSMSRWRRERVHDRPLEPGALDVDVDGDRVRRELRQALVERRGDLRGLARRVREHELAAGQREDVELDHVDGVLERRPQRVERVLRRQRGRAAVADPERPVGAAQVEQRYSVLRIATTATSSVSSPPKARQSSTTLRTSVSASRPRQRASTASSRSVPYSTRSRRASITPSV